MKLSAWITVSYLCTLIWSNPVQGADDNVLYGHSRTIHCQDQSGDWFHNGMNTGVSGPNFTITNANFSMSGQYQCKTSGGNDILSSPWEVVVYGYQNITPQHCDSIEDNVCVKNVSRGQTVTFCVDFPIVPLVIPQGNPTTMVRYIYWDVSEHENDYSCSKISCSVNESLIDGNEGDTSCIRIPNVTENQLYRVRTNVFFGDTYLQDISLFFRQNIIGAATTSSSVTLSATSSTESPSPSATVPSNGPISVTTSSTLSSENVAVIVVVVVIFFIIVFGVIAVTGVVTFVICRKKRFQSQEIYCNVKPHSSKLSLQSPNVVSPSKSENGFGNHDNRPDKLTVLHQGVTVNNRTPGANSLQPLISPGSSLIHGCGTSPSNGTHPQYPPPGYSAIMSAQEAKSRENLSLNLGNTNQEQSYHGNNSDDVDDGDFGAGPLEEAQDIQIRPNK